MSQEFDSKVLGLVKQKGSYPCKYMSSIERLNKTMPSKNEFYSSLKGKGISDKDINMFSKLERILSENNKKLSLFVLKMWCFIVSWCIWKT